MCNQSISRRMRSTQDRINLLVKWRKQVAVVLWVASFSAVFSGAAAMAVPTVLDFEDEDIATGTTITAEYGLRGVLFQNAYLDTDSAAHSPTRVLRTFSPSSEVFVPIPLRFSFTSVQAHVKLFAGVSFAPITATLMAFDANGGVVGQDGPRVISVNAFTTVFEVTTTTAVITRLELQPETTTNLAMDDLEFEGEPPAPPPLEPPVVEILSPVNGSERDVDTLDIAGIVTGEGLLSPVTVTVAYRLPPESTAPPITLALDLTGSGTTRSFSLPGGFGGVPMGPITITASAENFGGLTGTATSTVTNFPVAIKNRFNDEGGTAVLGEFDFGIVADGCKIAIYAHGAISGDDAGATHLVRGNVLTKWLSLRGPSNNDGFGCPKSEERDTQVIGGARVQDFDGGRIYGSLLSTTSRTAYVPAVFVDALKKRGDEPANGVPLADPSDSVGPMQTWLFQQFVRPDRTDLLSSTLEIRGAPPMLWMERQGGGLDLVIRQLEPTAIDQALGRSPATIWESFPCSGNLGPCTVDPDPPPPEDIPNEDLPRIDNAGALFCDGTTYNPVIPGRPPEWVAVRSDALGQAGNYVATPVYGAVVSNFMADIDNALTHEHHNNNCPYLHEGLGLAIGSCLILGPGCLPAVGVAVGAEVYGITCASDYEFKIRPIGPQPGAFPFPSLFGETQRKFLKVEYEIFYAAAAHNFLRPPAEGDLVHATGRWIIDCGHDTYNAELHPLFSFATMKTVISEPNTFTGLEVDLFGGKPATRVAIWINGWYPGGDGNAIEFDAFPPPRPNPDAVLHVSKPVDFAAGGYRAAEDVSLEFAFAPAGAVSHVHLRFTSPRRENAVTDAGEMLFDSGRQYWGIWYLYWGQ